jgi:acyl carrier protein
MGGVGRIGLRPWRFVVGHSISLLRCAAVIAAQPGLAKRSPLSGPISLARRGAKPKGAGMTDRDETFDAVARLIAPFNKKGTALAETTTFAGDLEWDSLVVMDFVANVEDEFDILITMNMQAEIETVGQLVDAIETLRGEG